MTTTSRRAMFDELSDDELALVFTFRCMNAAAKTFRETSGAERAKALSEFEDAQSDLVSVEQAAFADVLAASEAKDEADDASERAKRAERESGWDANP